MAGNFENNIFRKSARKKWTLFRGSRGLFQRVGTEMAEEGYPDAQFHLGKELLEKQCDSATEEEENTREGVYWLIQASEQGHMEATELLKHCLKNRKGITEHNISDVIECLETTRNEKLSVKAVKLLFQNFSEGEEFITSNQLLNKIKEVQDFSTRKEGLPQLKQGSSGSHAEDCDGVSVRLTEEALVSAAREYSRGRLPAMGLSLLPASRICRMRPVRFIVDAVCAPIGRQRCAHLFTCDLHTLASVFRLSGAHVKLLVLLIAYNTMQLDGLLNALPTFIYYISFIAMIAATSQMLNYRRDFLRFRCWSNLFISYNGGENFSAEEAEFRHCSNGLSSYIWFFVFLIVNLFTMSTFRTVVWFFQTEMAFVAFLFAFMTLVSFTFSSSRYMSNRNSTDYLGLFSFMLHILAKYPYETDSVVGVGWRFLDLKFPTFASYVVGNGVEFCLNFRAFFYLIIPAVLFKMSARYNWRGIYSDFIPHCVTLSWLQLTFIYAQGATWYSLIRPALALVGVVLFLPLTALTAVMLPAYTITKYLLEIEDIPMLAMSTILASFLPYIVFKKFANRTPVAFSFFSVTQIFISIVAALYLLSKNEINLIGGSDEYKDGQNSHLSVSEFSSYCNTPLTVDSANDDLESQLTCSQLIGLSVMWEGTIKGVRIESIHNPVATFVNKLPNFISRYLKCLLGEEFPLCSSHFHLESCNSLNRACQMNNWNRYEFRIDASTTVNGQFNLPVVLLADNSFTNFSRRLNPDDAVWFVGRIEAENNGVLKSYSPKVVLSSITCISCFDAGLTTQSNEFKITKTVVSDFAKFLLNYLFNPLIVFK